MRAKNSLFHRDLKSNNFIFIPLWLGDIHTSIFLIASILFYNVCFSLQIVKLIHFILHFMNTFFSIVIGGPAISSVFSLLFTQSYSAKK